MAVPALLDDELMERVLTAIRSGRTLRDLGRTADFPSEDMLRSWLQRDVNGFAAAYWEAKRIGCDALIDEALEIADDASNDWMERAKKDGEIEVVLDREHIERSKVRIQVRQWQAERVARGLYGRSSALDRLDADAVVIVPVRFSDPPPMIDVTPGGGE